jgi:hypothetical protein
MKTIALTVIAAGLGFAQSSTSPKSTAAAKPAPGTAQKPKSQAPRKATAAQKANPPVTIPEGAKQVEPNLYRYTDSNGKTWMYRQSPFGISKYEDVPSAAAPRPAAGEPVAVTDLGDSVRFQKKTAFGESQWVRKKAELTDDEKALVASQQQDTKPAPASNTKTPEKQ